MVKQHFPDMETSLPIARHTARDMRRTLCSRVIDSRSDRVLLRWCPILVVCLFTAICLPGELCAQPPGSSSQVNPPVSEATPQTPSDSADQPADDATTDRQGIPGDLTGIISALGVWFVSPFVVASIVALWFSIERLVILRHGRVLPRPFIERFLQHLQQQKLDPQTALQLCEENGSPVASVFAHGCRKWGKPSVEVEQAIIDGGERQISHLRKHLRVINGVATITPLIGLLGTVVGMIQAFNQIANTDAMGKAQELAVGIALALLTTAIGLVIAIPSLTVYMYLAGKVDALVMEMDHLAQNVVHLISAEGLANQDQHRSSSGAGAKSKG